MFFKKSIHIRNTLRPTSHWADFFKNTPNSVLLAITLFIDAFEWVYLFAKIDRNTNPIFLHYNIYFGIDLIGPWYQIFIMPVAVLFILLINMYISYKFFTNNGIFSKIILSITVVIAFFSLIGVLLIVRQNL